MEYVLGFVFDTSLEKVLLISKVSPEWQKGKVNGLGGKIASGETSAQAMARELKEESSIEINDKGFTKFAELKGKDWLVHIFVSVYPGVAASAKSSIKEGTVEWFSLSAMPKNAMDNLSWLIPMALDKLNSNRFKCAVIEH